MVGVLEGKAPMRMIRGEGARPKCLFTLKDGVYVLALLTTRCTMGSMLMI